MKNRIFFQHHLLLLITLILLVFFCESCTSKTKNYEPTYSLDSTGKKILIYGIPNISTYENCELFVKYLNENLKNVKLLIVACKDAQDYEEKMKLRNFDLTIMNGPILLEAEENGYSIVAKMADDDKYRSVIFVRNDSGITNISDLKGKTIAVSDPRGLAGYMMPLLFLSKKGLNINKDIRPLYTTSFASALMNVYLGKCTAGAAKIDAIIPVLKEKPEMAAKISVKWETPSLISNAVLIKKGMDSSIVNELTGLIMNLHNNNSGKKALERFHSTKFVKANADTYKPLEEFIKEFKTATQ